VILWVDDKVLLKLFMFRRWLSFSLFVRLTHFMLLDLWVLTDVGIGSTRVHSYPSG